MNLLLVGCGGFLGANARYFLGVTFNRVDPLRPYGTWLANLTGSILLALLFVSIERQIIPSSLWLLLGTGFCGAYTTFSTFGIELVSMLVAQEFRRALWYAITSIGISFITVFTIVIILK